MRQVWSLLLLTAIAFPLVAADFGGGDVFGQAGLYTELGSGGGSWPIFGGGGGVNLGSHAGVFGEFDYIHANQAVFGAGASGNLYQAGGGARIFIPVHNDRFRPYVLVAGGYMHGTAQATIYYDLVGAIILREAQNGGYAGPGAGAEIGLTKRLGLRPEFRFFHEFWGASDDDNGLRVTLGVYYRFGAK